MTTPVGTDLDRQTHERLRSLVVVNRAIVAELSLDSLLRLVVDSARTVVEAEYAVLEVVGADGSLEQSLHSGTDVWAATPGLGAGSGLSQVVPGSPPPLRLQFPRPARGAARLSSLLGVPIASAGLVLGNLFLANRTGGAGFSAEDEGLVTALAATAAIAIQNARLYDESHRRQAWLMASGEISQRLLSGNGPPDEVLAEIADTVRRLAPADLVGITLPNPEVPYSMTVVAASGSGRDELLGLSFTPEGSVGWEAMRSGRGVLVGDAARRHGIYAQIGPLLDATDVMGLPLTGVESSRGAIVVVRTSPAPFTEADLEMAEGFANQAALALELADSRRERQQLAVLEDRARIARDLHDHVVQKLFAVALSLQGAAGAVTDPGVGTRLTATVTHLDETIRSIRTSIFELQTPRSPTASFRARVMAVLTEIVPVLGFAPRLQVDGLIDGTVGEHVTGEVEEVLREALANVALHAEASSVVVNLRTDGRHLTVRVADDGAGLPPDVSESGLATLRLRAEQLSGRLELGPSAEGGLLLTWTIPI